MKSIFLVLALLSLSVMAVEEAKVPSSNETVKAEKTTVVKMTKKEAKKTCLSENEALKKDKKGLDECIKTKMEEKK